MDIVGGLLIGFQSIFHLDVIFYCFVGVFIGTLVGVLPGIGPSWSYVDIASFNVWYFSHSVHCHACRNLLWCHVWRFNNIHPG